jgi:multidrug efflux pump subunit AcrB
VNDEFGDVFGIIVTLTGDGFTYAELKEVADQVRDEVLLIDEAAKVDIHGAQEERVFVEFNSSRLAELGLSPHHLQQKLQSQNIVFPGGDITTGRERIVLEPSGSFESVEELARTIIDLPGRSDLVYLGDVAKVYRGYVDPPASKMHASGVPCLGLSINLREGGNIIVLGDRVRRTIATLQARYPIGIEFEFVAFQPEHVERKVDDFVRSLFQAVAIVVVVMLLALGVRTGLVVASLIPMAMIMSLFVMSLLEIGIDQMSLAALIIALGMLVDNAIVMSESITVQMREGKRPIEAAVASADELRVPLLTSSLTTAAAFLPIYLAESTTGEYTAPLFKVVTITLLCSWVLSLTMIPLFCVRSLRVEPTAEGGLYDSGFYRGYRSLLLALLRRPAVSLLGVLVVFVLALQGFRFIPNIFFPSNDKAIMTAELELPVGAPIELTESVVRDVEAFMASELKVAPGRPEGITSWATFIGQGAPRFVLNYAPKPAAPEYAIMLINATSRRTVDELIGRMEEFCTERFPDLRATVMPLYYGPPPQAPVEVRISGENVDEIFRMAGEVKARLRATPGPRNVRDDWGTRTKKLLVHVDQPRARRAGLTSLDVARSLQTILTGYDVTQYREEDQVIPVTLRSVESDRQDIGKLEGHRVFSQTAGSSVPLSQVADIEIVWQPAKILRRDRLRTVTVGSDVALGASPIEISSVIDGWLAGESAGWPVGYKYALGGELENSVKANRSIQAKLPIAALIIIVLLVGQFNSIRRSVIILLTIPLGLIGVVIGLLIARSYFGFMTFLGVISLAGIVINNAIVLLDRIKIEIEKNGLAPPRAIVESAQRRLRPILLTTCTTVGGLLPLWFGGGAMWEPMAIAIIFGLIFATGLTLGVVPVLYSILFRVRFKDFSF